MLWLLAALPAWGFDHGHAAWTALLGKHVVPLEGGKASRVRYAGMAQDRAALRAYLDTLSAVRPAQYAAWSPPERLAFLINAYNAFTIEKVLTRYPDLNSIRDFGTVFGNPWKDRFFTLLGRPMSLDILEHDTIRAPGVFDEPRVHFALNCASVGCPSLREEAYTPARLEAQLEDQARRFLSDRSRNRLAGARLEVSKIFQWYRKDFTAGYGGIGSVEQFLARHAHLLADTPEDRARIKAGALPVVSLDYDWALNDAR